MTDLSQYDAIVSKLQGLRPSGSSWTARCPAHEDNVRSLSVATGDDGRLLVKCHAGTCSFDAIVEALGVKPGDFFPDNGAEKPRLVKQYRYEDEEGKLLYEVCRYQPKSFRQRRPDGNGWAWNLDGVRRVLYRLPDLVKPANKPRRLFLVEGEKDVDRLVSAGMLATTMCGGASNWRKEYTRCLAGRHVAILPDNDPAGEKAARAAARELNEVAASVTVLHLPELPEKGDVSDWLDAGHTPRELQALVGAAKPLGSLRKVRELAEALLDEVERVSAPSRGAHSGL